MASKPQAGLDPLSGPAAPAVAFSDAPKQNTALFDGLVGLGEQRRRRDYAERALMLLRLTSSPNFFPLTTQRDSLRARKLVQK